MSALHFPLFLGSSLNSFECCSNCLQLRQNCHKLLRINFCHHIECCALLIDDLSIMLGELSTAQQTLESVCCMEQISLIIDCKLHFTIEELLTERLAVAYECLIAFLDHCALIHGLPPGV